MLVSVKEPFDFLDERTQKILAESRESFIPHTPYQYEKNMLSAVKNGNLESAIKCAHLLDTTGKGGTLSCNPLRQAQFHLVSHITLITRAVLEAGVPEDLAFAMSDSYIQISQDCTSPQQIMALKDRSVRDFTGMVIHLQKSPPYSKAIRLAINHIHSHLQEKISLEDLAGISGVSVSRFSHLFKEETSMTPLTYVTKKKMEAAQNMLLYSRHSLSEISAILGYSSESHFIQTFKKFWGTTPGKFRK